MDSFQSAVATGHSEAGGKPTGAIPVPYKLPAVCEQCNRGWMGRLEDAARLVLVGFLEGKRKLVDPYDQVVIATWATKTTLTYDAARDIRRIPAWQGTRPFFQRGRPLPDTQVRIGHDPDHIPQGELVHGRHFIPLGSVPLDAKAVHTIFQFDHLLIDTIINYGDDLTKLAHRVWSPDTPKFQQVWPVGPRVLWPSDVALVGRAAKRRTDAPMTDSPSEPP